MDDCYQVVGTFPNKRLVLDNDDILEVYDKYWKYTTVSNHAGDYMIFGVPTGSQILHVDLDMSDIGVLSQSPRDFMQRGYDRSEFENPSQFKYKTWDSIKTEIKSAVRRYINNVTINNISVAQSDDERAQIFVRLDYSVSEGNLVRSDSIVVEL